MAYIHCLLDYICLVLGTTVERSEGNGEIRIDSKDQDDKINGINEKWLKEQGIFILQKRIAIGQIIWNRSKRKKKRGEIKNKEKQEEYKESPFNRTELRLLIMDYKHLASKKVISFCWHVYWLSWMLQFQLDGLISAVHKLKNLLSGPFPWRFSNRIWIGKDNGFCTKQGDWTKRSLKTIK